MKKVCMVIAGLVLAFAANAGSLTWSCSGVVDAKGTQLSGVIAYLFIGDSTAGVADSITAGSFTGDGAMATATTSAKGVIMKTGIGSYASETVSAYMVVFDAATIDASNNFMVSGVVSQTFGATGNKTFNFTSTMPSVWTPTSDVPEPTSGLLLLVGGAMLALRRKQK